MSFSDTLAHHACLSVSYIHALDVFVFRGGEPPNSREEYINHPTSINYCLFRFLVFTLPYSRPQFLLCMTMVWIRRYNSSHLLGGFTEHLLFRSYHPVMFLLFLSWIYLWTWPLGVRLTNFVCSTLFPTSLFLQPQVGISRHFKPKSLVQLPSFHTLTTLLLPLPLPMFLTFSS